MFSESSGVLRYILLGALRLHMNLAMLLERLLGGKLGEADTAYYSKGHSKRVD
jgi:hypothetical protein